MDWFGASRFVLEALGDVERYNQLSERDKRRFHKLAGKPILKLTEADHDAWMKLGKRFYGGEMGWYTAQKWRLSLYTRRGIGHQYGR